MVDCTNTNKRGEHSFRRATVRMVDVVSPRCTRGGCTNKVLSHGVGATSRPTHCKAHAAAGRIVLALSEGRSSSGSGAPRDCEREGSDIAANVRCGTAAKRKNPGLPPALRGEHFQQQRGGQQHEMSPSDRRFLCRSRGFSQDGGGGAFSLAHEGGSSSLQAVRSRRTPGIRLRPTPPIRQQAGGRDMAVVNTEVSATPDA